jgi:hypothetical protein
MIRRIDGVAAYGQWPSRRSPAPVAAGYADETREFAQEPIAPWSAQGSAGRFFSFLASHEGMQRSLHRRERLTSLDAPYAVAVEYADSELGVADVDTLALYYWEGSQWAKEPTSTVDTP